MDIKVRPEFMDIGEWRAGFYFFCQFTYIVNEKMAIAGRAACKAWGLAAAVYAEKFTEFIPDDKERKAFGDKVRQEFQSGNYHLSFRMYETLLRLMPTIGTW